MPSPEDWRDITIYQIFTDRFHDGDPSNNHLSPSVFNPTDSRRIHGGDFRGIEQKLDYIKALGADAIWISPIPLNVGHSAYHGYGAHDFYTLSPHWGTMADLRSMVSNAHVRGIYVILDIVTNHKGDRIGANLNTGYPAYNPSGYPLRWWTSTQYPPPFDQLDHFHNFGEIQNLWYDPPQILGELMGLDDLKTETEHVRTNMIAIYSHWIEQGGFDGFRIDTVKHVEMGFWQVFNPAIREFAASLGKTNFFQFGEVYDGSDAKCGSYTGTQAGGPYANDSVLDFPLYFQINDVFARATAPTMRIRDRYHQLDHYHPDARDRLVTFLDNHDFPRFMNAANANNNTARLHVATTFLYTSRGIPSLYYGTEQNFNGGHDPQNRENMFDGQFPATGPSVGDRFDMTETTFQHIARLTNFRRLYPALRRGTHHNLWHNPDGPGLFAYARRLEDQEVFVMMNTSPTPQQLAARPTMYPPGTRLVNLLNTQEIVTVTGGNDGIPPIPIAGTTSKIFIAESYWQPLNPVVVRQAPAHAGGGVPWHGGVTLDFSQPMETNATQSAFSIYPPMTGSFLWSSDRMRMTFVPSLPGLPTNQRVDYRVGTEAFSDATGQSIHGGFESFFTVETVSGNPALPADGLPGWWRMHSFGTLEVSLQTSTRAEDDFDGDGLSNLEEFIAGTDPANPASFLKVDDIYTGSDVHLAFPTRSDRWYRVLFADGLEGVQHWEPLSEWTEGTGGRNILLDDEPMSLRAYRLEVGVEPSAP
ncbi:MAG TPA: alpha-amylase family glycosyl hydrolase [Kiritimatiellia bacterium]|nr:alpha-amylase family glycosyl hydrolase [Kiritimatiellia bacterium]